MGRSQYFRLDNQQPKDQEWFLEPTKEFYDAISGRLLAKKVVDATKPIETIAKYEMYFLMGMISTMGVAAWLAVTGTDIGYMFISQKVKMEAATDLGDSLANESNDIETYAPVLHAKLLELLLTEPEASAQDTLKKLPADIIHNEKAQAQVSGILFGKMEVAPKSFTLSALFITILTQIAVKPVTNSPGSYVKVINSKYGKTVSELASMDLQDPKQSLIASQKLSALFNESGVTLTEIESQQILREVVLNPKKLQRSLINLDSSFTEFNKAIAND